MALSTSRLLLRSPPPPPPPNPYPKTLIPNTIAIAPAGVGAATPRNPFWAPSSPNRRVVSASAASSSSWAAGDLRPAIDENPEGIISGEWPENIYFLGYDDLRAYLESQIISSDKMKPTAVLGEVMSKPVWTAMVDQKLEEINNHFEVVSGLPVIDAAGKCIGVISKKDTAKALKGLESKVGEVMSSPAITLPADKTVLDAAALMLKRKVHRIPILDKQQHVVGIVTRTDVFRALESQEV
ncbi:uncharacterized protein LOC109707610 [Ananas comosus]|uniref:Uncharacterized protein LOC109707610 n=2 Tax=Ananas comosus TaxID=4615 RepID=A0A6P5ETX7_ANACO|nr:uncharacterized protein LOC109707610 [Ananas comosus]